MSRAPGDAARRVCDWPPCSASYDLWAVMKGDEQAPGWLHHPGFDLDMCGVHAPVVWGPGAERHRATGSKGAECGCGATLAPQGPTLGDLSAAYLRHIVAAADEGKGRGGT